MTKKLKNWIVILSIIIAIICLSVPVTYCYLYHKRPLIDYLPNEKIISISKKYHCYDELGYYSHEEEIKLPEDQIDDFYSILKELTYVIDYNFQNLRYVRDYLDGRHFEIVYETHTVTIKRWKIVVYKDGEVVKRLRLYDMYPKEKYTELEKFFE